MDAARPFRLPGFCLFKALTGVPCPGCGVTRSILALASGHFAEAWRANPAGPFVALFFAASAAVAALEVSGVMREDAAARARIVADRGLAAILVTVWTYRVLEERRWHK